MDRNCLLWWWRHKQIQKRRFPLFSRFVHESLSFSLALCLRRSDSGYLGRCSRFSAEHMGNELILGSRETIDYRHLATVSGDWVVWPADDVTTRRARGLAELLAALARSFLNSWRFSGKKWLPFAFQRSALPSCGFFTFYSPRPSKKKLSRRLVNVPKKFEIFFCDLCYLTIYFIFPFFFILPPFHYLSIHVFLYTFQWIHLSIYVAIEGGELLLTKDSIDADSTSGSHTGK